MIRAVHAAVGGLLVGLCGWCVDGQAAGQDLAAPADAAPTDVGPSADVASPRYQPGVTCDALQAGRDAYRAAEEQRRWAINRQLWLLCEVKRYLWTPWPRSPGDFYGYPYYPWLKQPIGHEKIWTGPNSYIYLPRYAPSATPRPVEAARLAPPPGPVPETIPLPPPRPVPETIPLPPPESGPREF